MKRFLFALPLLLLALPCFAQSWSNILPPTGGSTTSRASTNWVNAGLPPSFKDKGGSNTETTANGWTLPVRTQSGATVNPSGVAATDLSNINTALANCTDGHYVLLGPGTFLIQGTLIFYNHSCDLRAASPTTTTLAVSGAGYIELGAGGGGGTSCIPTSSPAAGATSITCTGSAPTVGYEALFSQCDTGYSGSGACTGTTADNGGLYICGDNDACQIGSDSPLNIHQNQTVIVTSVSGTGPYTVGFSPALYMPNWSTAQTMTLSWSSFTYTAIGVGLSDMTIYSNAVSANQTVQLSGCYACWVKGTRWIGAAANGALAPLYLLGSDLNSLVSNNYFFEDLLIDGNFGGPFFVNGTTASLMLNNISASGVPSLGEGQNVGNVFAYNFARDAFTLYTEAKTFDHHAYSSYLLFDSNQVPVHLEDNTWGTHDLNTYFRNLNVCYDAPYTTYNTTEDDTSETINKYHRMENFIGNAQGTLSRCATYQGNDTATGVIWSINTADPLVSSTLFRWGNVSVVQQSSDTPANSGIRFVSSEVPTSLASPNTTFQVPVPSNNNLPCSFWLPTYTSTSCTAHPSGGTGLNWWKVCKTWTTFPTSCATTQTQPFPTAGPDVTGGSYVNGHAYDIPAAVAWQYLPIDTTYQKSYTITGSSWSGGIETLTVSTLPNTTHLMGAFQLSGVAGACSSGATFGGNNEILMTGSSSTTIQYALVSNPGTCTGTFKFPDVRQFDENVYMNDPSGPQASPPSCSPTSGTVPQTVTCTNPNSGTTVMCYAASPTNPATNGLGTACSTGTKYTTALSIASAETLNVIAGVASGADSTVSSYTYTGVGVPTVTTTTATSIAQTTAVSGGTVISNGGSSVTSEGVCYSTTANPTSPCTSNGTATPFTSPISGLTPSTTYFYRAFATNTTGTGYGSDLSFTTLSTCQTPTSIGVFTSCGSAFGVSPASSTTQSVSYNPYVGNGIELIAGFCPITAPLCSGFQAVTVTLSDNLNSPESCFTQAPHSPYQITNSAVPDNIRMYAYYCPSIPAGVTGFTISTNVPVEFLTIFMTEWKAGSIASTGYFENVDQAGSSGNTSVTSASMPTSGSTIYPQDVVTAMFTLCGGVVNITPGAGYTGLIVNPAANPGTLLEAMAVTSTGIQTATASWVSGGTAPAGCQPGGTGSQDTWYGVIVPLVGTGVSLSPSIENFGSISVGSSSSAVTFTLANSPSDTTVTGITPTVTGGNSGDFTIINSGSGSCSAAGNQITAGTSCTLTVTFSPSASGSRSTTLSVAYSGGDGASPKTSSLSGLGVSSAVVGTNISGGVVINGKLVKVQ